MIQNIILYLNKKKILLRYNSFFLIIITKKYIILYNTINIFLPSSVELSEQLKRSS